VGILDKDLSSKLLLQYPALYSAGQKNHHYNQALFWAFMVDTIWQSLVLFYVPFFTYDHTTVDLWGLGSLWTIAVVLLVNIHLAMDIQHWTWIHHVSIWGSIIVTWICILVMDSFTSVDDLLPHYWYAIELKMLTIRTTA
jgi:phospholipid-transporting ATPase